MRACRRCLIITLAFCAACSDRERELATEPVDSLMIEIFIDIHLSNARSELGYGENDTPLDSMIIRHGLSRIEYDQKLIFYSENPDTYLAVLNQVTERLAEESRLIGGF